MNTSHSNGDGAPEEDEVARVLRETLKGDPPASCGRKMTAALEKFRRDLQQHPYVRRLEGRKGKTGARRWAPPVVAAAALVATAVVLWQVQSRPPAEVEKPPVLGRALQTTPPVVGRALQTSPPPAPHLGAEVPVPGDAPESSETPGKRTRRTDELAALPGAEAAKKPPEAAGAQRELATIVNGHIWYPEEWLRRAFAPAEGESEASPVHFLAYVVCREEFDRQVTEIWTMAAEAPSGRWLRKTYLGSPEIPTGRWLPGEAELMVRTSHALWTLPRFEESGVRGGPVAPAGERTWLLHTCGHEIPLPQLSRYDPAHVAFAPVLVPSRAHPVSSAGDRRLAFCGSRQPDPEGTGSLEGGVWMLDIETRMVDCQMVREAKPLRKVLEGDIKTPLAWSADGRYLVTCTHEGSGGNHPLVLVDAESGAVRDLDVRGSDATFSPDGKRVAYCGNFHKSEPCLPGMVDHEGDFAPELRSGEQPHWICPIRGSVFVLDLESGGPPVEISPAGQRPRQPRWSPDGTRVAYWVTNWVWISHGSEGLMGRGIPSFSVFVAQADGSGVKKVHTGMGRLRNLVWAPGGIAICVSTEQDLLVLAANGAGVVSGLGGNAEDSVLPDEQRQQIKAALADINAAIASYRAGGLHGYCGRVAESREAFERARDLIAQCPSKYPLAGLWSDEVMVYADEATKFAGRSDEEVLADACRERMNRLTDYLLDFAAEEGRFPPDLPSLEAWVVGRLPVIGLREYPIPPIEMAFRCPSGEGGTPIPFVYSPPADGRQPRTGDVLVRCPKHPECRIVWSERLAKRLRQRG